MTARRAEIAIESLVLDGVAPGDAELVGAAVERGLARLVREHGAPAGIGAASPRAQVDLRQGEPPAELGERLAGAIFTAISGGSGR